MAWIFGALDADLANTLERKVAHDSINLGFWEVLDQDEGFNLGSLDDGFENHARAYVLANITAKPVFHLPLNSLGIFFLQLIVDKNALRALTLRSDNRICRQRASMHWYRFHNLILGRSIMQVYFQDQWCEFARQRRSSPYSRLSNS